MKEKLKELEVILNEGFSSASFVNRALRAAAAIGICWKLINEVQYLNKHMRKAYGDSLIGKARSRLSPNRLVKTVIVPGIYVCAAQASIMLNDAMRVEIIKVKSRSIPGRTSL